MDIKKNDPVRLDGIKYRVREILSTEAVIIQNASGKKKTVNPGSLVKGWSVMDEAQDYALSDCVNWDTNTQGDCGGRVERVNGVVICETCRNKPRKSTVFDRPEGNVYILPEGTDL